MADQHTEIFKNYVGGQWLSSNGENTYEITSPANKDSVLGSFQISGVDDVSQAVDAAHSALASWADTPAPARAHILYKALEIMERRSEELAETITIEEGKPISDARGEVRRAMNIIEYAAGEGRRMFGYTTPSELPNTVAYTVKRPLGVVGIITPWNFPLAIPAWKIAPALICGNTIVFKPASSTPMTAVKLVEIFEEAGIPEVVSPGYVGGESTTQLAQDAVAAPGPAKQKVKEKLIDEKIKFKMLPEDDAECYINRAEIKAIHKVVDAKWKRWFYFYRR